MIYDTLPDGRPIDWSAGTSDMVKEVLIRLLRDKRWVRLYYGDPDTGQWWGDENDVLGHVSHSTGTKPCLILVHNARSMGGGAILTGNIVAIQSTPMAFPYRHAGFKFGDWRKDADPNFGGRWIVRWNGKEHAGFVGDGAEAKAERYIRFMRGERMAK